MNCMQSDEHNIGFLSEIYCGIHQLSNDFLELHDQVLKENKQIHSKPMKKEKSHFGVNCQKSR